MTRATSLALPLTLCAALLFLPGCNPDEEEENTADTETTTEQSAEAAPAATIESRTAHLNRDFLVAIENISVTRPNGESFDVSVIAYCGEISEDFDDASVEYRDTCEAIIAGKLNYRACGHPSFAGSVSTNNPEIRAFATGRALDDITPNLLLSEEQVLSIGGNLGYDAYTVTDISDLTWAGPPEVYQSFVPGEDCPSRFYAPEQ